MPALDRFQRETVLERWCVSIYSHVTRPRSFMRFRQLRYFCKIVECKSFTRAAATIHIAQPALSEQIAELEAVMGVELLHRSARGVRATEAGEVLYREATALLRHLDRIPALIRSSGGVVEGTVSLGYAPGFGARLMTHFLAVCQKALPKVTLQLIAGDNSGLRDRVEAQTLDLALIFETELQLPLMSRRPLYRQRLYYIGPALDAQSSGSLSLAQLAEMPLLLTMTSTVSRMVVNHAFSAAGLTANVVAEINDSPSLFAAVRAGLGGTILPIGDLTAVGVGDLPPPVLIEPPLNVTCAIVANSDIPLTAAGEAVRKLLPAMVKRGVEALDLPGATWIDPE
jgi:LysR family transcriptional regulator, nitrogen assimilation regulatory protein